MSSVCGVLRGGGAVIVGNRCSWRFCSIHGKPVLGSLFNGVGGFLAWALLEALLRVFCCGGWCRILSCARNYHCVQDFFHQGACFLVCRHRFFAEAHVRQLEWTMFISNNR